MIQKPSKTAANRPGTPAVAPETTIVLRETVTVSRATPAVLGHTPDVSGTTPGVLGSALKIRGRPVHVAMCPNVIAIRRILMGTTLAARYTPFMANSGPRHSAKTRWALTIATLILVIGWCVSAWGHVSYVRPGNGGFGIGAGNIQFESNRTSASPAPTGFHASWFPDRQRWSFDLYWMNRGAQGQSVRCSLLVPAMVTGILGARLWYRRYRPFFRPGRPNRARQFAWLRWMAIGGACAAATLAVVSHWRALGFTGNTTELMLWGGDLSITCGRIPVGLEGSGFSSRTRAEMLQQAARFPPWKPYVLVMCGGKDLSEWLAQVSLWFVAFLFAAGVAVLSYFRNRHYPAGRCPSCQYDLTGLAAGTPCPECGGAAQAPRSTAT